ncbi:MAG: TrkA family potassium uptake protein [Methanosphaera sp.]|nr:TrkA family potassium uptake protein [Methanosphaera sp.]
MNGIILGAGRIGFNLARRMDNEHDITIIDNNRRRCHFINDLLECYVINGNGTDIKTLEDADISNADFFVATTGNDEVNLLSSVYAKDNGVKTIVSTLNNNEHEEIFKKLGIKYGNAETSAMKYIVRSIIRPTAQSLVTIGKGDAEIIEVELKNSDLVLTPVCEIQNDSDKFIIISVYVDDEVIIPTPDTEIDYGDIVTILVKSEYVKEVEDLFTTEGSDYYYI